MRSGHHVGCIIGLIAAAQLFAAGPEVGKPAPPLRLEQVLQAPAGTTASWESLRSNVVVVDFWATWCGPCVESIPHWNELADSFKGQPVKFLAVTDENKEVVTRFLQKRPIHSWVGLEGLAATKQAYDIRGIPTTVIVNQTGAVVAVTHPAVLRRENIQEVIDTGASSLPKRRESTAEDRDERRVPLAKPMFELSVRRAAPVPKGQGFNRWTTGQNEFKGECAEVLSAIHNLYDVRKMLIECACELPKEQYDFTVTLPEVSQAERELLVAGMFRSTFHLDVQRADVERECHILKKSGAAAPGLNPARPGRRGGGGQQLGGLNLDNGTLGWTISYLESWLGKPVIDETGDTNRYDIRLKWKLSKAEGLTTVMDRKVLRAAMEPNAEFEKKLTPEQRKEVAAIRGELKDAEMESFSSEERDNIRLLRAELAKPENDRFAPDIGSIITAVEQQWGVKLETNRRKLPGLRVTASR